MNPTIHDLRLHRKHTCLSLKDVADLLGTKDLSQISRYEHKPMHPQLEICMLYHLLFGIPIQLFFPIQKRDMRKRLIIRIPNIIDEYKALPVDIEIQKKIDFFTKTLSVLNAQNV